jgi:hypothetical protein
MLARGVNIARKSVQEHMLRGQALQGLAVSVDLVEHSLASNILLFWKRCNGVLDVRAVRC